MCSPDSCPASAAASTEPPTAPSERNSIPTGPSALKGPPTTLSTVDPTAPPGSNLLPTLPSAVNACETFSVTAPDS